MTDTPSGKNTILAHSGYDPLSFHGFVNPPVVRGSTVLYPDAETLRTDNQSYTYGTHGTPTTDALCAALNELEGAAGTILAPSGLAAVTLPLLTFLSAGDHVLLTDSIYGPSRRFANEVLTRLGISVEFYDPEIGAGIETLFRPETRVVFLEAPGSNTFEMQDIPAITALTRRRGIITMIDNCWATPLLFRPLDHGVDIVIHAATKYFGGHADVLMGTVSANAAHWKTLDRGNMVFGFCVGSDDAYTVLRGLRSLGRRLEIHERSTLEIAGWVAARPEVARVFHPALESDPGHALWKRDFKGSSSLFSFALKPGYDPARFLNALRIFALGYSYGGYESLALKVNLADRLFRKPDYDLDIIRLQIGLEDVGDLIADLDRAFTASHG